jgi:hypothetical protein
MTRVKCTALWEWDCTGGGQATAELSTAERLGTRGASGLIVVRQEARDARQ